MKAPSAFVFIALTLVSCTASPPAPPVHLPKGEKIEWDGTSTFWDRNGDGRADRLRLYKGSGYAREYFDDDFNGTWDGGEHAPGGKLATGLKENRIPEKLSAQDHEDIRYALRFCIPAR